MKLKKPNIEPFTQMQVFIKRSQQLVKILIHEMPTFSGYKRKDPFECILHLMTKVHEIIKYYTTEYINPEYDEWDLLGTPSGMSRLTLNCPLFDNTTLTLSLNYSCKKCDREQSLPAAINFLKLSFPKKKRKVKEVEKELAEHRFSSPVKHRRKSLVNLFKKQQQCPFTIPELIIQFLKQPLHKDKICTICKEAMQKNRLHFQVLPQYLLIQINRMGSDGNSVDQTNLEFSLESLDLGPFTGNKSDSVIYQFETAICVENMCSYPVVANSRFNKQTYIFKNQLVSLLKLQKSHLNPYIICYKRQCTSRDYSKLKDCYHNIKSSVDLQKQSKQNPGKLLPDFWLCQLKHYIPQPLNNQLACKHRRLRPHVQSKMRAEERVPEEVYQYLIEMFKGRKYADVQCKQCLDENERVKERKKLEKQKIIQYEKLKSSCHCMISNIWLKKWMNFLYGKGAYCYFSKGHPMPGPIDNKSLLDGQKCRSNLQKNEDYKVVNIWIWKFLKQLYGGGPEIRYKWNKNQISQSQQQKIRQIRQTARQIKQTYVIQYIDSPKKSSMIIQKTTSFVQSVRGSEQAQQLSLPQQIS